MTFLDVLGDILLCAAYMVLLALTMLLTLSVMVKVLDMVVGG